LGAFLGLRCKPLYLYFPEELLPISQPEHLQEFLRKFGAQPEGEVLALNRQLLLLLRSFPEFEGIDTYQIGEFLYHGIGLDESSQSGVQRVWKVAPGPDAQYWDMCRDRACIAVGWLDQTDFREFPDRKSVEEALEHAGQKSAPAGQIMRFTHRIKKGDIVIANKGIGQVVGIGKVVSDYIAPTDLDNPSNHHKYRHARLIDWVITEPLNLGERVFPQHTVSKITSETWERIRQGYIAQDPKLKDAFVRLTGSETPVEEPEEVIIDEQRYSADIGPLVHLAEHTKNFILYGPPGTGKTFLVRKFAEEYLRPQFTPEESVSTFCTSSLFTNRLPMRSLLKDFGRSAAIREQ
jgi:5-methylcytosine-specific restriction protein B